MSEPDAKKQRVAVRDILDMVQNTMEDYSISLERSNDTTCLQVQLNFPGNVVPESSADPIEVPFPTPEQAYEAATRNTLKMRQVSSENEGALMAEVRKKLNQFLRQATFSRGQVVVFESDSITCRLASAVLAAENFTHEYDRNTTITIPFPQSR